MHTLTPPLLVVTPHERTWHVPAPANLKVPGVLRAGDPDRLVSVYKASHQTLKY